jgi:hypothetical protein
MPVILSGRENLAFYEDPMASWWHVSSGYFAAMGIQLIAGRTFDEKEKEQVAIVSETAARRIWPGENPIGKIFLRPINRVTANSFKVVGVVKDVREYKLGCRALSDDLPALLAHRCAAASGSFDAGGPQHARAGNHRRSRSGSRA